MVYSFAPDWKEDHVQHHLMHTRGIPRADGYKGYAKLYEPEPDGTSRFRGEEDQRAFQWKDRPTNACWAHLRRDFHDIWVATKSEIAREALNRIGIRRRPLVLEPMANHGSFYDIERDITGQPADARLAARKKHSRPKVEAFFVWSERQLPRIPGKGDVARAFRYGLGRMPAFCLFLEDGRVAMDNEPLSAIGPRTMASPAERALRPIGIGRKNWLFAGADTGAETLARAMTIIETAKMNGLDPQACLAVRHGPRTMAAPWLTLSRINDHMINRLDDPLPWNWAPVASFSKAA